MNAVKLFLIDEVGFAILKILNWNFFIFKIHVLGENSRGATIEVVVSRMKTYALSSQNCDEDENKLRFIAVSATIPNINDVLIYIILF